LDEITKLWVEQSRRARGKRDGRPRPSKGIAAVLLCLHAKPEALCGSEIARLAGQFQSNVTGSWLPKLEHYGFVHRVDVVPGLGHQGGGRPAHTWALTARGTELAGLIEKEGV
jgi:hypothetical protein